MTNGSQQPTAELQRSRHWSQSCYQNLFAIDLRSLALFRVSFALVMLVDLIRRAADLTSMYAHGGALPLSAVHDYYGEIWKWSFHLWNDAWGYQALLFGLAGCCGLALLVGYRTRQATCLAWILTCSLNTRAPLLVNGGDVLLCMGLFWGMFLPLGARFSIDARRQPQRLAGPGDTLSIASAGILLQIAMMYVFTGLWKLNPVWLNGDAVAMALSDVTVRRPFGNWLLNFPSLLHFSTQATVGLELLGPLLLFSPVGTRFLRPIALVCFLGLHIGIEMSLTVMMFSYASLALLTLFVPGSWWNRLSRSTLFWKARSDRLDLPAQSGNPADKGATDSLSPVEAGSDTVAWPPWCKRLGLVLGCCCIGYVTLYNVFTLTYRQGWPPALNKFSQVGTLLNFGQRWTMFDSPQDHLYRFAFFGRLKNGQQVELLRNQATSQEDPFPATAVPFPSQRWMQLHREATAPVGFIFRHDMARYLATHWNQTHPETEQFLDGELVVYLATPTGEVSLDSQYQSTYYDARAEGPVRFGLRQGKWVLRHDNGVKSAAGQYRQGQEVGEWIFWNEAGKREYEGSFIKGQKQGPWTFWNDDGSTSRLTFHDDELIAPIP